MRLTPKQAESLAKVLAKSKGEALDLFCLEGRTIGVRIGGKQRITIGGRGKVRN